MLPSRATLIPALTALYLLTGCELVGGIEDVASGDMDATLDQGPTDRQDMQPPPDMPPPDMADRPDAPTDLDMGPPDMCTPPSDRVLCEDEQRACGELVVEDACGMVRRAQCGECGAGERCGVDGQCCVEDPCAGVACGEVVTGCAGEVVCGCGVGDVCVEGACMFDTLTNQDASAGAELGSAVALDGDWLAVGAPRQTNGALADNGEVLVFERNPEQDTFELVQTLRPSVHAGALAGWAVALSGDTLLIGAPDDDTATLGLAYVYRRSGPASEPWVLTATLGEDLAEQRSELGRAVAIDGQNLVIGAPGVDFDMELTPPQDAGEVLVYTCNASFDACDLEQVLRSPAPYGNDEFGSAVVVDGDELFIAALDDDGVNSSTSIDYGKIFRFRRAGDSAWAFAEEYGITMPQDRDFFGTGLAVRDKLLVAGAPGRDDGALGDVGRASLLDLGAAVSTQQLLTPPMPEAEASFGAHTAVEGGRVFIGAPGPYEPNMVASSLTGEVYVYERSMGMWMLTRKLTSPAPLTGAQFGRSIAADGDIVAIGAPLYGIRRDGAVFLYRLP